jgi:hypothetical protein
MRRGVRVDLQAVVRAFEELEPIYGRDVRANAISDEAIERIGTIVRNLNSALDKTANGVELELFGRRGRTTSYPIVTSEADFDALLEANIRGLQAKHPQVADAFRRHQPFQAGQDVLAHLKPLYREYAHHDFTRQERKVERMMGFSFGGMNVSIGQDQMQIGGSSWYGVPLDDAQVSEAPPEVGLPMSVARGTFADWYFKDPPVSVAGTLRPLIHACGSACHDIAVTAGLSE